MDLSKTPGALNSLSASHPLVETPEIVKSLARSVDEGESLGLRNMPWKAASESALSPTVLNLDWLVQQPDLPFLVRLVPPQVLSRSLQSHGMHDALEVIEWIRGNQLIKVLDHEVWEFRQDIQCHDISVDRFLPWLQSWLEIDRNFVAARLNELEEETLVLLFSKLLDIQPEGIGRPAPEHEDDYWQTGDNRFHLRMLLPDPELFEVVRQVLDALYETDAKYAASILSFASMLVRDEALERAERWRKGRMADEGFVERDEALSALRPRGLHNLQREIGAAVVREQKIAEAAQVMSPELSYFGYEEDKEEACEEIQASFRMLDSGLAMRALERVLSDEDGLLLNAPNLRNPEVILDDEEIMRDASEKMLSRCTRLLSVAAVGTTRKFATAPLLLERATALLSEQNPTAVVNLKSRFARISNMFLSAVGADTEADSQARCLSVVRGALNIGIERCMAERHSFAITTLSGSLENQAAQVLQLVGPEFLFQVGWNTLLGVAERLARVVDASETLPKPTIAVHTLIEAQRYAELRRWLGGITTELPEGVLHVFLSILNRIPYFPELVAQKDANYRGTRERRAFETLADVALVEKFIAALPQLILE